MADNVINGTSTNGIAVPNNVKYNTNTLSPTNWYGDGTNQSSGKQIQDFYLKAEANAIKQATAKNTFTQFASVQTMKRNHGRKFMIQTRYNIYDRTPWTDNTWNDPANKEFSTDFLSKGWLSSRSLSDVTADIYGTTGITAEITNTGDTTANGIRLLEGQLNGKKISPKFSTFQTTLRKFGRSLDYTDDLSLLGDAGMIAWYYDEMGKQAGQDKEDLIQLAIRSTPNRLYAGSATSMATLGTGIGTGDVDQITKRNAIEDSYKINFKLIQKIKEKLIRFRVPKHHQVISGSTGQGTKPIDASWVAIVGPEILIDLENITRGATVYTEDFVWIPVSQYPTQAKVLDDEIGSLNGIRFIYSEQMLCEPGAGADVDTNYVGSLRYTNTAATGVVAANKFDVFQIIIPGADAFATVQLEGQSTIQFMSKDPRQVDSIDNFGSIGFFSYKMYWAGIILRPERLMRVDVLASA